MKLSKALPMMHFIAKQKGLKINRAKDYKKIVLQFITMQN